MDKPQKREFMEVVAANPDLKNSVTHVIFILDRSGSMSGMEGDVIGGFNSYVDGLKKSPNGGDVGISYVRFDTEIELVWDDLALDKVPVMTRTDYVPRGNTALLDAIGMTISAVKNDPDHSYIVITHTDGHENSSREWTKEKIKELLKEREALGNWTITFFGQDIDAWGEAGGMGYSASNTMAYAAAATNTTYVSTSRVTNVMRSRGVKSTASYAAAANAINLNADITDDELEKILNETDPVEKK